MFSSSRIWLGYSRRPWVWTRFPLQPLGIPLLLHTVFVPWGNEAKTIRAEQKRIWGRRPSPAGGLGDGILTCHHSQAAKSEQGHEVGADAWEKVCWRSQTTENDSDVHGIYIRRCGKAFGKLPAKTFWRMFTVAPVTHRPTSENTQLQHRQEIIYVLKRF